ncbi:MAG: acyl-CoA dehydrogenase family protein [Marinosulfonomonas sp.]|nr:acyl-CoA dehydrogenase family protein [Marinosulfonomonas sp.]
MSPRNPIAHLPTHDVTNMPPHIGDQDFWTQDIALREGVAREGGSWANAHLADFGVQAGREEVFDLADQANRFGPELKPFDRYGMRTNQVSFHPAYHALHDLAVSGGLPNFAWNNAQAGAHVAHAALNYMFNQVEGGVVCPMAMTYAAIQALKSTPAVADEWLPKLLSTRYDRRDIPLSEKTGAQVGMFMTEKQGGSDVRTNSTQAVPDGDGYLLTGHKYFCSAPMSDAFLTLAYTDAGLTCFLVPRFTPDGRRNGLFLQRLKDKLGNKSNASSEMELQNTWGAMVGPDGCGIKTIIDMVQGTRFYCAFGSAALMRQGLVQALHHTTHRAAFQKKLIDQPLMRNVLADLAIESEAATTLSLRLGRAIDQAEAGDTQAAALARIGTAIGKYWICKRTPNHTFEAMECHGGPGYVEESIMPRLFCESPVNSIWEGSGNVICLDVLRALHKDPETLDAFLTEVEKGQGQNANLDKALGTLKKALSDPSDIEMRARRLTEQMALVWQAALLVQHAPAAVSDAFCASRLGDYWSGAYGTLPVRSDFGAIITRASGWI